MKGKVVRKKIEEYYLRKKHYSKDRAEYIAGAVAREEHLKKARKRVRA